VQQKSGLWHPFQISFPNPVAIRQKSKKWSRWKIGLHRYPSYMGPNTHRCKKQDLSRSRQLLGLSPDLPKPSKKTTQELMLQLTGIDVTRCPFCKKGTMKVVAKIPEVSGGFFNPSIMEPKIKDNS